MTKPVAHSPTPWGWDSRNDNHYITDMDESVVLGPLGPAPDAMAEADRELIVRAVNSHAALVEALTHLRDLAKQAGPQRLHQFHAAIHAADEALLQAEGR